MIFGSSRSGKSALAKDILKKYSNYNLISIDCLVNGLLIFYPEIKDLGFIRTGKENKVLPKYLNNILCYQKKNAGGLRDYILEGEVIKPKDIKGNFDLENSVVVFLGYPNMNGQDKLNDCRKYDGKVGWTAKYDDEEILGHVEDHIKFSKYLKDECKNYGFKFFDTSKNRNKVLNDALIYIENNME